MENSIHSPLVNCWSFSLCTQNLFPCFPLVGPDLNKNEGFNYQFCTSHPADSRVWKETNTRSLLSICKHTAPAGADQFDFDSDFIHRYERISIYWSSTRFAGRCVSIKASAPNAYASQKMMLSKSGAFLTFCQRTNTRWSSSLKRWGRFLQLLWLFVLEQTHIQYIRLIRSSTSCKSWWRPWGADGVRRNVQSTGCRWTRGPAWRLGSWLNWWGRATSALWAVPPCPWPSMRSFKNSYWMCSSRLDRMFMSCVCVICAPTLGWFEVRTRTGELFKPKKAWVDVKCVFV